MPWTRIQTTLGASDGADDDTSAMHRAARQLVDALLRTRRNPRNADPFAQTASAAEELAVRLRASRWAEDPVVAQALAEQDALLREHARP